MTVRADAKPFQCPVCQGCGQVPPDFYQHIGAGTSTAWQTCRTCSGTGLVWRERPEVASPPPGAYC